MIPNRLGLYWQGGPMSWLRLQTVQTFARLHPGWEIELIAPEPSDGPSPRDVQADIARWRWLYNRGGWFSDTDIIWLRPIPEEIRGARLALTVDGGTEGPNGRAFAIGLVGAARGERFMGELSLAAEVDVARFGGTDHQVAGTRALARHWPILPGCELVTPIPARQLYPWGFRQADLARAWEPTETLPDGLLGLHWSGGHPVSRRREHELTWETYDEHAWARRTPVEQALCRAYGDTRGM